MPLYGDDKRSYEGDGRREERKSHRDIGPPPKVKHPRRRARCKKSLREFLTTYHPEAFPLAFSPDHDTLIAKAEQVLTKGGHVVVAMPRGSGKTTIFSLATLWAALYGHRRFTMLIAADDDKYKNLHEGLKRVLEYNELLYEDFPEVCHPVRALDQVIVRANYQLCDGVPTNLKWASNYIMFPDTKYTRKAGNACSVIKGGGITSSTIRGSQVSLPDGTRLRPDAVLIDDPQTRASAKSPAQCQEREDTIKGDILGMAGPGKRIATMCTVTVIYEADLAERLLDRERSPTWDGLRVSMIKTWPKNMDLWEKYDRIRRQAHLGEVEHDAANKFYLEHREQLDEGSSVYWNDRVDEGCVSAIQSAMNDWLSDPKAFMCEKQNAPTQVEQGDLERLNPLTLVRRQSPYERGQIPADVTTMTAHVDVQGKILFWMVCGWTAGSGCYVVDYGTTPKQSATYFTLATIRRDMKTAFKGTDEAGALRAAIRSTIEDLNAREWKREDGVALRLNRGLVDGRWRTADVHAGIKASLAGNWMPALGTGIGAKDLPMALYTRRQGIQLGNHYMIHKPDKRMMLVVSYDTNYWKTETHQSLVVAPEHTQACLFYKAAQSSHQMLADHLCAERSVRVAARNRVVDEWSLPSNEPDNHWWDTLVGCRVAAALCGINKEGQVNVKRKPAVKRVKQLSI